MTSTCHNTWSHKRNWGFNM